MLKFNRFFTKLNQNLNRYQLLLLVWFIFIAALVGCSTPPPAADADILTCSLEINCRLVFDHLDQLDPAKIPLVPTDGIIYSNPTVSFQAGDSVFDILLAECQANQIHMEYVNTPLYDSNYIEGIHNLYEFDCGPLSGWVYRVNGYSPNYGSAQYLAQDNDVIEWFYSCNLGKDIP